MSRILYFLIISFPISFLTSGQSILKYSVPERPWEEWLGNHRAIIDVPYKSEVAYVNFFWRRNDKDIEKRRFIIINAQTRDTVKNIYRLDVNNENCELFFGPVEPGTYYFYYLPFQVQEGWGGYWRDYLPRIPESSIEWIDENNLTDKGEVNYVKAECKEIQSRQLRDSFYPMKIIATRKEKDWLINANANSKFILFPEDRKYPIKMLDNIPQKWILNPVKDKFSGFAERNEYYTFQIGLWAIENIEDVTLEFTSLKGKSYTIPESALTCFNTGGIDPSGNPFDIKLDVGKEKMQPLWIGVDIPRDLPSGNYQGKVIVRTKNAGQKVVDIELEVSNDILENRGDGDMWRHSRLRWLNSRAGIDDKNIAPFEPVRMSENKIILTHKEILLNNYELPAGIKVFNEEILSAPIEFNIISENKKILFSVDKTKIKKKTSGILIKKSKQKSHSMKLTIRCEIESDGWMKYTFDIEALDDIRVDDIQLEIPYRKEIAQYIMGMGLPGSDIPEEHEYKWEGPHDSFWIGNTEGGLYCELRGASYMGPLLNLYKPDPPASWYNDDRGGFRIRTDDGRKKAIVYSGARELEKGDKLQFECAFIITPVKEINTRKQFTERHYQGFTDEKIEQFIPYGIKIISSSIPSQFEYDRFLEPENNPPYNTSIFNKANDYWHSLGLRVKSYYQTREIYDIPEIWAFRSLGTEILAGGNGGGHPWLREHYVSNYTPQWYHREDSVTTLTAILTSGESRLFNFYIEGIKWLMKETGCDGFYIDDSIFDREIVKRMKRVMYAIKPDSFLDLHSNTGFSKGPATQYTEYFPYIDKIWFGESFQYSKMPPANWLVEVSGIPFGLMGDMLQLGGNQWLGMVYGMTNRLGWVTDGVYCDPRNVWKVWDDFGIADSKMIGYWDESTLVSTSNEDVYATAYLKDSDIPMSVPSGDGVKTNNYGILISIGNWSEEAVNVKLDINFSLTNLDPGKVVIKAPYIENFQPARTFLLDEEIPIESKKGWLLILEEQYIK